MICCSHSLHQLTVHIFVVRTLYNRFLRFASKITFFEVLHLHIVSASGAFAPYTVLGGAIDPSMQGDTNTYTGGTSGTIAMKVHKGTEMQC